MDEHSISYTILAIKMTDTEERRLAKNAKARAQYLADPLLREKQREMSRTRYRLDPVHREKQLARSRARYYADPAQSKAASTAWKKKNGGRPEVRARGNWYSRKSRYGLTDTQFAVLWEQQRGCCALCLIKPLESGRGTHIDHCHVSDKIRGLLCPSCNASLAAFDRGADWFDRAWIYCGGPPTCK